MMIPHKSSSYKKEIKQLIEKSGLNIIKLKY